MKSTRKKSKWIHFEFILHLESWIPQPNDLKSIRVLHNSCGAILMQLEKEPEGLILYRYHVADLHNIFIQVS